MSPTRSVTQQSGRCLRRHFWLPGTYKPTAYLNNHFPFPGPGSTYANPGPFAGGTATFASVYGGTNADGVWRLYAIDAVAGDFGSIDGGWSLTFTTGACASPTPAPTPTPTPFDTTVVLAGGELTVTDAGTTSVDTLTISRVGANVRINDPNNTLGASARARPRWIRTRSMSHSLRSRTSSTVNTLGGNDTLTVDVSGGDCIPGDGVFYNGGPQTGTPGDKLAITGNGQGTVIYNYTTRTTATS